MVSFASKTTGKKIRPPKRWHPPFMVYFNKNYTYRREGHAQSLELGKKWTEMNDQEKKKYFEESLKLRDEYLNCMKKFSDKFATEKDKKIHISKLKKPVKLSVLSAFTKERTSKMPIKDRLQYVLKQAKVDYKKLTSSEFQMYQQIADDLNKERREKYEAIKKRAVKKSRKLTVYQVMVKDRCTMIPKEERWNYAQNLSSKDYRNLSPSELQIYRKMADEIYKEKD